MRRTAVDRDAPTPASKRARRSSRSFTIEDFIARSGAGASSLELYEQELRVLERRLGMPLGDASERALERLKKELRQQLSGPQRALFLRMFFKAAYRATKDPRYPDLVELMRMKQRLRRISPDEVLTLPEINALIAAANSLRDRAMIAVLWESGVRIHELCALRVKDVMEFTSKENGGKVHLRIFFPKVKVAGEEHSSYLLESVDHVQAWLRAHPDPRPDAPLFPSAKGGAMTRSSAEKIITKTARRARIRRRQADGTETEEPLGKRVYPHLFRHSRCTHLLRIGVPEAQVKKLLGWKPSSPMLARYAHLVDRDAYAALLRAHGLEPPELPKEGGLVAAEGELRPVVPMNLGPHTGTTSAASTPEARIRQLLLANPDVLAVLEQLDEIMKEARTTIAREKDRT